MRYFYAAHTEYMRAMSSDHKIIVECHNADFHIVEADTEFHAPARWPEELAQAILTREIRPVEAP